MPSPRAVFGMSVREYFTARSYKGIAPPAVGHVHSYGGGYFGRGSVNLRARSRVGTNLVSAPSGCRQKPKLPEG